MATTPNKKKDYSVLKQWCNINIFIIGCDINLVCMGFDCSTIRVISCITAYMVAVQYFNHEISMDLVI